MQISESSVKKKLIEYAEEDTPQKNKVSYEINPWGDTFSKASIVNNNINKGSVRNRRHRKLNQIQTQRVEISSTPTVQDLKKQREQLMKTITRMKIDKSRNSREATKPNTTHQDSHDSEKQTFLERRNKNKCLPFRVNQFQIEGEKKIEPFSLDNKNQGLIKKSSSCPKTYRKLSLQYRIKKKQTRSKSINVRDKCEEEEIQRLREKFKKNLKHHKWVLELNRKSQDFVVHGK